MPANRGNTRFGQFRFRNGVEMYIPWVDEAVFSLTQYGGRDWSDIDVHDVSSTQRFPVGTVLRKGPRWWAYAESGGTIAAARLAQGEIPAAAHDALPPVAASAGATSFSITLPGSGSDDFVANEYAGGIVYAQVNGTPGYAYEIATHEAGDISNSGTMEVFLAPGENLAVALSASDDLAFVKNPWKEVIIMASPQTARVVGVAMGALTDGDYGWLGVKGPHPVLTDATTDAVVAGYAVRTSEDDDGAVAAFQGDEAADSDQGIIGYVADGGGDAQISLIDLNGMGLV